MSKYDQLLNEVVYQIDERVYDYYTKSNALIASKRSQDRLIAFRDSTLDTINDMNVRSLEIISGLKNKELVEERAAKLLNKNESIIASSLELIQSAPDKNEFLNDLGNLATGVYESAKVVVKKVEDSGAIDRIVDVTQKGFQHAKEGLDDFAKHPKVKKGTEIVKEKTKEAASTGVQLVKESSQRLNEWLKTQEEDADTTQSAEVHEETHDDHEA